MRPFLVNLIERNNQLEFGIQCAELLFRFSSCVPLARDMFPTVQEGETCRVPRFSFTVPDARSVPSCHLSLTRIDHPLTYSVMLFIATCSRRRLSCR